MPASDVDEFGLLLFGTARAWRTKLDQRLRPLGLTQGKWRTLMHLASAANELTQKQIAERMGIEEPTLAGLLDRLQNDGWIERRSSANDRRCKIIHLQQPSNPVLRQIFNAAHDLRHELLADIPPRDLLICMRVLERVRAKAEAVSSVNGLHKKLARQGKRAKTK